MHLRPAIISVRTLLILLELFVHLLSQSHTPPYIMTNRKAIIFSLIAVIAALIGIAMVSEVDFVRWATCNSPFSAPQDKASGFCKRLDSKP